MLCAADTSGCNYNGTLTVPLTVHGAQNRSSGWGDDFILSRHASQIGNTTRQTEK